MHLLFFLQNFLELFLLLSLIASQLFERNLLFGSPLRLQQFYDALWVFQGLYLGLEFAYFCFQLTTLIFLLEQSLIGLLKFLFIILWDLCRVFLLCAARDKVFLWSNIRSNITRLIRYFAKIYRFYKTLLLVECFQDFISPLRIPHIGSLHFQLGI